MSSACHRQGNEGSPPALACPSNAEANCRTFKTSSPIMHPFAIRSLMNSTHGISSETRSSLNRASASSKLSKVTAFATDASPSYSHKRILYRVLLIPNSSFLLAKYQYHLSGLHCSKAM